MTPDDFTRSFAAAFTAQNADALSAMLAPDGTFLTLTGIATDTAEATRQAMAQEFLGIFAHARLVTGKGTLLGLGPDTALVTQRYVVTGAIDEDGAEMPRFAALLVAVLQANTAAWQAISLTFTAVA